MAVVANTGEWLRFFAKHGIERRLFAWKTGLDTWIRVSADVKRGAWCVELQLYDGTKAL